MEFPEVVSRASEIRQVLAGAVVEKVYPPSKPHKFCWWNGDPASYPEKLEGRRLVSASGSGSFLTLAFEDGCFLSVNDGVVLTYLPREAVSGDYQLMLCFSEGRCLVFTVSMYGGICLHNENYENPYYLKSIEAVSPLSDEFPAYFRKTFAQSSWTLSAKRFLPQSSVSLGSETAFCRIFCMTLGFIPKESCRRWIPLKRKDFLPVWFEFCAKWQSKAAAIRKKRFLAGMGDIGQKCPKIHCRRAVRGAEA